MPFRRKQATYSTRPTHATRVVHAKGERKFRTYDTSYIRPKRRKAPLIIMLVIALVVIGCLTWTLFSFFGGCSSNNAQLLTEGQQVTVVVSEGDGAQTVGNSLQEVGLVSSSSEFTRRISERGLETALLPGVYTLTGGTSLDALIDTLVAGPAQGTSLTIPEGFTLTSIANRVADVTSGRISADEFLSAASDASVYAGEYPFLLDAGTNSLEGLLFPKTYAISDTDTADSIIRMMLNQYRTEISVLDYSYPNSQGLSAYQTLILASIVEKESPDDADVRAKVAAVFYNRLSNTGEPTYGHLGSDATTAYELGGDPSGYDWTTDSPYNTRVSVGLPPTPICSPSIESLEAVCSPAENFSDYYFFSFWSNDTGGKDYFFDKTYEEHQATIAEHS